MKQAEYETEGFHIKLAFCKTHSYPALEYDDGSVACMWEEIVETAVDEHQLIPLAWI